MNKKHVIFILGLLMAVCLLSFQLSQYPISSIFGLEDGTYVIVHQPSGNMAGILVDSLLAADVVEYQIDEIISGDSVFLDTLNPLTSEAKVWADVNIPIDNQRKGAIVTYSLTTNNRDFVWKYVINSEDSSMLSFILLIKKERVGNTVYVSKDYGNNNSAIREYSNFAFKTPWTAAQNAITGDILQIKGSATYSIGAVASGADYEYLSTNELSLLYTGVNSIKIHGNGNTITSILADPVFFNITTSDKSVEVKDLNFNKCSFKACVLTESSIIFDRCNFTTTDTSAIKFVTTVSDTTGYIVFKNCTFKSTHAAASPIYYSSSSTVRVFFYGCRFIGKPGVSEIVSDGVIAANKIFFDANCITNTTTINSNVTYSGSPLTRNTKFKL